MANITPDQSSSCHGILHRVTAQEFEVLKEIESNYGIIQLPTTPYTPCSSTTPTNDGPQHTPSSTCHAVSPAAPAHSNPGDASNSNSSGLIVPGVPVTATAFIVSPERIAAMTQVRCPARGSGSCPTLCTFHISPCVSTKPLDHGVTRGKQILQIVLQYTCQADATHSLLVRDTELDDNRVNAKPWCMTFLHGPSFATCRRSIQSGAPPYHQTATSALSQQACATLEQTLHGCSSSLLSHASTAGSLMSI